MKSIDLKIKTRVKCMGSNRTGRVICNKSRQGDEVVYIEWDDNYTVGAMNVGDLIVIR